MTPRLRFLLAFSSAGNLLQNILFPVLAVRALGVGHEADALFMVFVLVTVVNVLLANSVLNWVTPRLVRRVDDDSRRRLCWSLLWVLALAVGVLCGLLWLAAHLALAVGEAGTAYRLAGDILPLGLLAVLATVIATLAQCLYVAERDVPGGEWRSLVGSTLALLVWFLVDPATLLACTLLFTLRTVLMALALLPRLGRPRVPQWQDRDLREILRESRLLLLAATYYKSEPLVDRLLFASAPAGAVAAYHLAGQVLAVVTQLVQRVLVAPLIAPFAAAVHQADLPRMRRILIGAFLRALLIGIAVWCLIVIAGEALLGLLLADSSVSDEQVRLTARMMTILGGFMLAVLLGMVCAQAYYCTGQTRRVVVYSTVACTLGYALKLLALWQFGVLGLVAAIAVSWLLNVCWFIGKIPTIFREVAARGPQAGSL